MSEILGLAMLMHSQSAHRRTSADDSKLARFVAGIQSNVNQNNPAFFKKQSLWVCFLPFTFSFDFLIPRFVHFRLIS
jgi:hypothetical protein